MKNLILFNAITAKDIALVGGKNASLGEMVRHLSSRGIKVPNGFATTTHAYKRFINDNNLDTKIDKILAKSKSDHLPALTKASKKIKDLILAAEFSPQFVKNVYEAYKALGGCSVAVRSSATAEDLAEASFAGQQETYLNVKGPKSILSAIKHVYASLYTSRAISYRKHHAFNHKNIAISVGVQCMIRSDLGCSGVMFTIDTESGFDKVICINASYGLGEAIVQGQVNPDEFYVYKPAITTQKFPILKKRLGEKSLKMIYAKSGKNHKTSTRLVRVPERDRLHFCITDEDIQKLAHQALIIEQHYGKPMDIEWGKDGVNGEIYILQARPETIQSQRNNDQVIERYCLTQKKTVLVSGNSIGQKIGQGVAKIIDNPKNITAVQKGDVLVTDMTDPDWEPIMKKAAAIVTNRGGRTCHAAIVARELGIPAVVGCGNATKLLKKNRPITVSCAEGQTGYVYDGLLPFQVNKIHVKDLPKLSIKLCVNLGNPEKAFTYQHLPNSGVGLARLEFIIGNNIGIHPNAVLDYANLPQKLKREILKRTCAYHDPVEFYVEKLREGVATIAAAFYPKEVIFRFSDFKSNEYANLIGGYLFEPQEQNSMLGFRGASRYLSKQFQKCFELECRAFKKVRDEMGLTNAHVMVPFVRTIDEIKNVVKLLAGYGLKRTKNGLKIFMMCEIPSNVLLAEEFLKYTDGFSIGSNDLTQLTLGLDRDSSLVAELFNEKNEAVKQLLHATIQACKKQNKYIGICGQAPSDYPDFAQWLMEEGIESISLNPDSIVDTWLTLGNSSNRK